MIGKFHGCNCNIWYTSLVLHRSFFLCVIQDAGSRVWGQILFVFPSGCRYYCTVWKLVRADIPAQDIKKTTSVGLEGSS